jgi:hypothetical protein
MTALLRRNWGRTTEKHEFVSRNALFFGIVHMLRAGLHVRERCAKQS